MKFDVECRKVARRCWTARLETNYHVHFAVRRTAREAVEAVIRMANDAKSA